VSLTVKRAIRLVTISVFGVIVLAAWWLLSGRRTEVDLSPKSAEAVPRSALAAAPIYLQTNRDIETALGEGNPVLVKVLLSSGVQHWVLLVGRDQKDYLMKDPLGDGLHLEPLSTLDSHIIAVRIVRRM
jgi:hypothetical protein